MTRYIAALLAIIALSDVASAACSGPLRARLATFGTRTRIVERSRTVVARPLLVATTPRVLRIVPAAAAGGCVNGACAIPGTPAKK